MSAAELKLWRAYERVEPWGEYRMDRRFGRLMAQISNLWAERPPGRPPYSWQDYYPPYHQPAPTGDMAPVAAPAPRQAQPYRQTPEQMQAIMGLYVQLHHASARAKKGWAPPR